MLSHTLLDANDNRNIKNNADPMVWSKDSDSVCKPPALTEGWYSELI